MYTTLQGFAGDSLDITYNLMVDMTSPKNQDSRHGHHTGFNNSNMAPTAGGHLHSAQIVLCPMLGSMWGSKETGKKREEHSTYRWSPATVKTEQWLLCSQSTHIDHSLCTRCLTNWQSKLLYILQSTTKSLSSLLWNTMELKSSEASFLPLQAGLWVLDCCSGLLVSVFSWTERWRSLRPLRCERQGRLGFRVCVSTPFFLLFQETKQSCGLWRPDYLTMAGFTFSLFTLSGYLHTYVQYMCDSYVYLCN